MDLEQLQLEADKDLKINDTELDLESLKTPQLHNKYLKHLTKFKLLLTRAEDEFTKIKKDKWEYYTGKADPAVYQLKPCLLYTSPSPRDVEESRMPSSA